MIETTKRRLLLIGLCLAAAVLAAYWPVRQYGFINYDDPNYVTENSFVLGGLTPQTLAWALTTREMGHWHPLVWVSLMLDRQFFGDWAGGYHLVNVLWHVANTLLLFVLLQRITAAPWRSACVAALFALHPLHVESVAWISERKDVLNTFFLLLTLYAYVRYVEEPSGVRYWATVGVYALALMSKSMGVTLPFVLLLLDYWPLGRTRWVEPSSGTKSKTTPAQLLKEKIPFFVLVIPASVAAYWAEGSTLVPFEHFPMGVRLVNVLHSYAGYIGKTIWPVGLAIFYPLRTDLSAASAAIAGLVLLGVTAAAIRMMPRKPWVAVGWFWYLGTLVPVIGFVQIGTYSMADRYTYLPLIGLFIMLSWSLPAKTIAAVAAAAVIAVCGALARVQVGHWKNSEALFLHAVKVTKDNWLAHVNLGAALKEAGRSREEEMEQYQEALRIKPDCVEAHNNLGSVLWETGEREQALQHWQEAVRIQPQYADAHSNLGDAFRQLGNLPEAVRHYEQAWRIKPASAQAYNDFGVALWQAGETQQATRFYEHALQIKPDFAEAHYNLGGALERTGDFKAAIAHYEQALRIRPGFVEAQNRLERLRAGP